jgi:dipeptidyl aminopeptidase/acylaminoacyl peptidase
MKAVCVVSSLLLSLGFSSGLAQAPPLEAFAALPAMQSPSISPDGNKLAFIAQADAGSYILVSVIDTMAVTSAVDMSAVKPRDVSWANDDTLLALSSEAISFGGWRVESFAPYGVNLSGEINIRQLLLEGPRLGSGAAQIGGYRFVQGAQLIGYQRSTGLVLMPRYAENANRVLYAVDAKTDRRREVDDGSQFARDWVVDEEGRPKFRVEYTQKLDYFTVLRRDDDGWRTIAAETIEIPELSLLGLDDSGRLIVGARPKDVGRWGLYVMSAENGSFEQPFFVHDRRDVDSVRIDPYTNRVVGADAEGPVWFDAELRQQQTELDAAFRGESPRIVSWSQDRARSIVSTESSDRATSYYLFDTKNATVKEIASAYPALDRGKLPARAAYAYRARDGVEIPGYLTRPLGVDGPAPLILLPHGGPAAADVAGFDWLAQGLASRGYAVLQPNFRGSGGFGKAWEEAGHGQWGVGVMQHDLTDGVAALTAAGIADAERVCIVGASYGGYAALAGAAFTPELYRCAAAIAGVADLREMLAFSRARAGAESTTLAYWRLAMGVDETSSQQYSTSINERLTAASPAAHAERVQAPVLLIHGRNDTVVPIAQSRLMERALAAAGKSVQFIELDGEDHWLSIAATRLETLRALDAFLAEHLAD